jgi:hypothetical protein
MRYLIWRRRKQCLVFRNFLFSGWIASYWLEEDFRLLRIWTDETWSWIEVGLELIWSWGVLIGLGARFFLRSHRALNIGVKSSYRTFTWFLDG